MESTASCANCGKEIIGSGYRGEEGTFLVQMPLCSSCFNSTEPVLTVIMGDDTRQPLRITAARNHTGGQFLLGANGTLGPQLRSDAYVRVYASAIWKVEEPSEEILREFDKEIRRTFRGANIAYAKVFVQSPSEYYKDYELWVKSEHTPIAIQTIKNAISRANIIVPAHV
jgi:hypothetical protein